MKVLMFGWDFATEVTGGVGTVCKNILDGLKAEKINVTYVLPNSKKEIVHKRTEIVYVDDKTVEEVTEHYQEDQWEKVSYLKLGSALMPYVTPEEFVEWRKKVVQKTRKKQIEKKVTRKILKEVEFKEPDTGNALFDEVAKYAILSGEITKDKEFDIIHAHDWMSFKSGLLAKELSGKPLVLHVHSTELDRNFLHPNPEIFEEEKNSFHRADAVVVVSEAQKGILTSDYNVPEKKIHVVYNSLKKQPIPFTNKNNKQKNIAFVGRLADSKGVQFFLDVARELSEQGDYYKFHIAGSGPLWNNIKQKIASMNLKKSVKMHGMLTQRRLQNLLRKLDLIYLPSITEPFGMAVFEGIQSGVPVVTSKAAGISEVSKSLIKVDYWDTYRNTLLIKTLLEDARATKKYVDQCQAELNSRSWKDTSRDLISMYSTLIP